MTTSPNEEEAGPPAAPVQITDRLPSLDVLRGFALLGILLANIQDFGFSGGILHDIPLEVVGQSGAHPRLDAATMVFQWLFVEGRMRTLFSLLFGAGTVLLLDRIEARAGAGRAADIFHRRAMWLAAAGLIHGFLIWAGDILLVYALMALLFLYPLRHVSGRRLATAGFLLAVGGGTVAGAHYAGLPSSWHTARLQERAAADTAAHRPLSAAERKEMEAAATKRHDEMNSFHKNAASGRAGYLASEPGNVAAEWQMLAFPFHSGYFVEVLGAMIAGMGLYRLGFLSARWSSRAYATIAGGGYILSFAVVLTGLAHSRRYGFSDVITDIWMFVPYDIAVISGMMANASVLLLLIKHRRLMPMQRALAAVGRTALSNYLLTSLICQFVFKWGPWKLYGKLEYYEQFYVVAAVWSFNIVFSMCWLQFFAFGPFEWLWRSLTYWQRQRFQTLPARGQSDGWRRT